MYSDFLFDISNWNVINVTQCYWFAYNGQSAPNFSIPTFVNCTDN